MKNFNVFDEENQTVSERYELVKERICEIAHGKNEDIPEKFREYFTKTADFAQLICNVTDRAIDGSIYGETLEVLKEINLLLYEDIIGDNYLSSYMNPEYSVGKTDEEYGILLSVMYSFLRGCITRAFKKNKLYITRHLELLSQVYCQFEQEDCTPESIKNILYYFLSDYSDLTAEENIRELTCNEYSYMLYLMNHVSMDDERYMYLTGYYITENEINSAKYLRTLSEDEIWNIAKTYTEGYRKGFIAMRIDMSAKKNVEIRYHIGFEKVILAAIKQFSDMGLKCIIRSNCVDSTWPNRQCNYDHRFDLAYFYDKALVDRKIDMLEVAFEKYKKEAQLFAGPAVIETFGENPFEPLQKKYQIKPDETAQKLNNVFNSRYMALYNKYIPGDTTSFTIIAYPIPEIGEEYVNIFEDTIKINNLDSDLYQKIQGCIIDALDKGDYAHVVGKNGNITDIKVNLWKLNNPATETIFENCVADVNIPVGEVFTSPVLNGTNGILNVSSVFLNGLKYSNLILEFKDGMISRYSCDNFADQASGKEFIKENLLKNKETLPMGEFAIGTNTTAYVIANKYDIIYKLPILIVEKMGPHFAVGDTCYKYSEDTPVYNPDGKEIVARENEWSKLRNDKPEKAYFNCHTDITIPYDEIGKISVIDKDGKETFIIKDGRFVLEGCEELNKPFNKTLT